MDVLTRKEVSNLTYAYENSGGMTVDRMSEVLRELNIDAPSPSEIAQLRRHVAASSSIFIELKTFLDIVRKQKVKHNSAMVEQTDLDLTEAFVAMGGNRDRTGNVSATNLIQAADIFHLTIDTEKMMAALDTDGNGQLSFQEFESILRKPEGNDQLLDVFASIDFDISEAVGEPVMFRVTELEKACGMVAMPLPVALNFLKSNFNIEPEGGLIHFREPATMFSLNQFLKSHKTESALKRAARRASMAQGPQRSVKKVGVQRKSVQGPTPPSNDQAARPSVVVSEEGRRARPKESSIDNVYTVDNISPATVKAPKPPHQPAPGHKKEKPRQAEPKETPRPHREVPKADPPLFFTMDHAKLLHPSQPEPAIATFRHAVTSTAYKDKMNDWRDLRELQVEPSMGGIRLPKISPRVNTLIDPMPPANHGRQNRYTNESDSDGSIEDSPHSEPAKEPWDPVAGNKHAARTNKKKGRGVVNSKSIFEEMDMMTLCYFILSHPEGMIPDDKTPMITSGGEVRPRLPVGVCLPFIHLQVPRDVVSDDTAHFQKKIVQTKNPALQKPDDPLAVISHSAIQTDSISAMLYPRKNAGGKLTLANTAIPDIDEPMVMVPKSVWDSVKNSLATSASTSGGRVTSDSAHVEVRVEKGIGLVRSGINGVSHRTNLFVGVKLQNGNLFQYTTGKKGQSPVWNERIVVPVQLAEGAPLDEILEIGVFDKDKTKPQEMVAQAAIKLSKLHRNKPVNLTVGLFLKDKNGVWQSKPSKSSVLCVTLVSRGFGAIDQTSENVDDSDTTDVEETVETLPISNEFSFPYINMLWGLWDKQGFDNSLGALWKSSLAAHEEKGRRKTRSPNSSLPLPLFYASYEEEKSTGQDLKGIEVLRNIHTEDVQMENMERKEHEHVAASKPLERSVQKLTSELSSFIPTFTKGETRNVETMTDSEKQATRFYSTSKHSVQCQTFFVKHDAECNTEKHVTQTTHSAAQTNPLEERRPPMMKESATQMAVNTKHAEAECLLLLDPVPVPPPTRPPTHDSSTATEAVIETKPVEAPREFVDRAASPVAELRESRPATLSRHASPSTSPRHVSHADESFDDIPKTLKRPEPAEPKAPEPECFDDRSPSAELGKVRTHRSPPSSPKDYIKYEVQTNERYAVIAARESQKKPPISDQAEAATKIQANFRGFRTRKGADLQVQTAVVSQQAHPEPAAKAQPVQPEKARPEPVERASPAKPVVVVQAQPVIVPQPPVSPGEDQSHAAVVIQKNYRGFKSREVVRAKKSNTAADHSAKDDEPSLAPQPVHTITAAKSPKHRVDEPFLSQPEAPLHAPLRRTSVVYAAKSTETSDPPTKVEAEVLGPKPPVERRSVGNAPSRVDEKPKPVEIGTNAKSHYPLEVVVQKAEGLMMLDGHFPYVSCRIGTGEFMSSHAVPASSTPVWNEKLQFQPYSDDRHTLNVLVCVRNLKTGKSHLLGEGTVEFGDLEIDKDIEFPLSLVIRDPKTGSFHKAKGNNPTVFLTVHRNELSQPRTSSRGAPGISPVELINI